MFTVDSSEAFIEWSLAAYIVGATLFFAALFVKARMERRREKMLRRK